MISDVIGCNLTITSLIGFVTKMKKILKKDKIKIVSRLSYISCFLIVKFLMVISPTGTETFTLNEKSLFLLSANIVSIKYLECKTNI